MSHLPVYACLNAVCRRHEVPYSAISIGGTLPHWFPDRRTSLAPALQQDWHIVSWPAYARVKHVTCYWAA